MIQIHHIINVITKIQRQTLMILLRIVGYYIYGIMEYMKATFSSYYKDKHL